MIDSLTKSFIPVQLPTRGDLIEFDSWSLEVIGPVQFQYRDLNNYSLIIRITFGDNTVLLTGDMEFPSERAMLSEEIDLDADILQVGHHGSDSSTSSRFLDAVTPDHAVISVGADNDFGFPDRPVLRRLDSREISTYRTDLHGTVVFTLDRDTIEVTQH